MPRPALFASALLACVTAGCADESPRGGGIVSINPCADAMLVELLPPERIAAISHYSADPVTSSIAPEVARRFRATRGTAEEVIAMRPDLVIASAFTPPATRAAFERVGMKPLYLDSPVTIDASREQVRTLAAAIGAKPAGEAMVARIDNAVAANSFTGPRVPALLWISGNLASGGSTLLDDMMTKAGFSNHAAHYGLQHTGYLPAEHLVADPPAVMLVPDEPGRDARSRAAEMRGWVLAHARQNVVQAHFSRNLVNCGGPVIERAMARLAEVRRTVRP